LKYLEIEFMCNCNLCDKVIEFINSLRNRIAIDASFREFLMGSTIQTLLDSTKIKYILKLRLLNSWDDALASSIMGDRKIIELELYSCNMSLEEFLLNEDFRSFRDRVRVLGVSSIGNLDRGIANVDLRSLELDRLHINRHNKGKEDVMNLDQLVSRGIITGKYFKYLVFKNIHHKDRRRIVDLRNRLGEREWPVVLTSFKPQGAENVDYSRVCWGYFYELLYR